MRLKLAEKGCKGRLITFCGLDGCGKTTQIARLAALLEGRGVPVFLTRDPTDFVRNTTIFRGYMDTPDHAPYDYRALSLLCAADRVQHSNRVILPKLEEGYTVISDRYFYSCLANLRARGYRRDRWIYEIAAEIPRPDLAFFLDVEVDIAVRRVRARAAERDRYIDLALQHRLREEYRALAAEEGHGIMLSTLQPEEACAARRWTGLFEEVYGLSCVENQLLALLREEGNDIRPLYHNAAVPLEKLVGFFMREGGKPYRFYEVPRIQDELTELGVLHVRLIRMADRERLWEGLRHRREKQWILARVLPSFTTSVLRARGLREDHYVRVEMRDNALLLYNDIPEKTLRLEKAAFSAAYADEILLLTLYRGLDAQMKDCLWERRLFRPDGEKAGTLDREEAARQENASGRLVDLLGVYGLLRRRMRAYYGQYVDTDFIGRALPEIDRLYARAGYAHLRGGPDRHTAELLRALEDLDAALMGELNEKLKGWMA